MEETAKIAVSMLGQVWLKIASLPFGPSILHTSQTIEFTNNNLTTKLPFEPTNMKNPASLAYISANYSVRI